MKWFKEQPILQGSIKRLRFLRQGWVLIVFSQSNPAGLAAGSRWSARVKGPTTGQTRT